MQTYTQVSGGIVDRFKDIVRLYQVRTRNVEGSIEMTKVNSLPRVSASATTPQPH